LDDEELDLGDIQSSNPYGCFRHHSESYPDTNVTVYHYRNIENEQLHVDLYEYSTTGSTFYFEKQIDDEDVTEGERVFEAS